MGRDGGSESLRRLRASLSDALGPVIVDALHDPRVVEVMLNPSGRLFVERVGEPMRDVGEMRPADAEMVIGRVAHALKTEVDQRNPIISGELPLGGHRFEGVLPPAATAPLFNIRKRASMLMRLETYVSGGILSPDQAELIRHAIRERWNIVVCGGTGTGKTTLTNAIIAELADICPGDRLLILEDTAEIQCSASNFAALHTTDVVDMARLLKSVMRLRPDRIIVGEVRDGAALSLLKSWNTGHPGGIATLHSNNARAALTRLEQLVAEVSTQPMREVVGEAIDLIISIERTPSGRRVKEILRVEGYCEGHYTTSQVTACAPVVSTEGEGELHVA